jgi:hypothetical protein
MIYIVTYLLKAMTVEPGKQPLLANVSETIFVSRQRLGKQVPAATATHAIIMYFWKRCFLLGPCKRVIRKTSWATKSILYGNV